MPKNLRVDYIVPETPDMEKVLTTRALKPFDEAVLDFFSALSGVLLSDKESKKYPDLVSFAFWCRKSALLKMKERAAGENFRMGRGLIFHIAPSNVPLNFAYSFAAGLLAGNVNIVRLPNKDFPQVDVFCKTLTDVFETTEHKSLRDYVTLIRYDRSVEVTAFFSKRCDVRIIWGGDQTVSEIRSISLPPRSFDLTFADRYSICVVNADAYMENDDDLKVARGFFNDTYLFDQNACTAPHIVIWTGNEAAITESKKRFWRALHGVVSENYVLQAASAVDKLTTAYVFASRNRETRFVTENDNLIVRMETESLCSEIEEMRSSCGYFYEYSAAGIDDIEPVINSKYQTLAYYGFQREELKRFMDEKRPRGIDRIVPIGRTLDFSLMWDGYDLAAVLTRTVDFF